MLLAQAMVVRTMGNNKNQKLRGKSSRSHGSPKSLTAGCTRGDSRTPTGRERADCCSGRPTKSWPTCSQRGLLHEPLRSGFNIAITLLSAVIADGLYHLTLDGNSGFGYFRLASWLLCTRVDGVLTGLLTRYCSTEYLFIITTCAQYFAILD